MINEPAAEITVSLRILGAVDEKTIVFRLPLSLENADCFSPLPRDHDLNRYPSSDRAMAEIMRANRRDVAEHIGRAFAAALIDMAESRDPVKGVYPPKGREG